MEEKIVFPMSDEEKKASSKKTELAIKYGIFTSFDQTVDDDIMGLSDEDFYQLGTDYKERTEFYTDLLSAKRCVLRGEDVPEELWSRIKRIREAYERRDA